MKNLDQRIEKQRAENDRLAEALREEHSLTRLEERARDAGFVPKPKLSFILPEPHVAFKL